MEGKNWQKQHHHHHHHHHYQLYIGKAGRRPASTTLDGRSFHDLTILVQKQYLYALTFPPLT